MKICVLGAGVIGVSTAYALARLGHDVSVIDKAPDVAMGASYANGAQLSYSFVDPLASPGTLRKLPSYLLGRDDALKLNLSLSPKFFGWALSFLLNCSSAQYNSNRAMRQSLSELSNETLELFESDMQEGFQITGQGKLVLAQNQSDYDNLKSEKGFIDRKKCLEIEPSLCNWRGDILGGVYSESDVALNTLTYCRILKTLSERKFGVRYFFKENITSLPTDTMKVRGVQTDEQFHSADNIVVCLGNHAQDILKSLGIKLPIIPIQGYSLTLKSKPSSPRVSVTDLEHKMVYANLGDVFRIAGFVDANQNESKIQKRLDLLLKIAKKNWPDVANFDGPIELWHGARPMTPSGVPIIKESPISGLYLNLGHGSLGYTFAAGSAMRIANMIGHAKTNKRPKQGNHDAA